VSGERICVSNNMDDYDESMSPTPSQPEDATLLLAAAAGGDKAAADRLLPLVYEQLRKAAQLGLAGEREGHTLSATALVHEAYLRLVGPREVEWASRGHFYVAAAEAMRRILIDYARARGRHKRGPTPLPMEGGSIVLSVADLVSDANSEQIVRLDEALRRLESEDPDVAQVVRLRFYAGLSGDETASALGKSPATVDRDWAWARAWLFRQLRAPGS
jgi:RNA polymerase sigma factor (TIGR02999 family)